MTMKTTDPKERLAQLLKQHNLHVEWNEIFCHYYFVVKDGNGKELWRKQGVNLRMIRDSLLEFLETYTERPATD